MHIYDRDGQERDAAWLQATFGPVQVTQADASDGADVYRLQEVRERCGPSAVIVAVHWLDGTPQEKAAVLRHWPGAPKLPDWTPPPERWRNNAVIGKTNGEGLVGFGMGQGDYYFPPDAGASAIWIGEPGAHSDLITGLGMLGGTDHCHLDLLFQRIEGGAGPGPGPSGDFWTDIGNAVIQIGQALKGLAS